MSRGILKIGNVKGFINYFKILSHVKIFHYIGFKIKKIVKKFYYDFSNQFLSSSVIVVFQIKIEPLKNFQKLLMVMNHPCT
jgi:hypothetical protein